VICIIESVEEGGVEWMKVLKPRETFEYGLKFLGCCFLREFNLACVKGSYPGDLEATANLGGKSPLSSA
jgi:hypothetical protein